MERLVQLEQERVEQHDAADRDDARLEARHEDQERESELKGRRDALHAAEGAACHGKAPPVGESLTCTGGEALLHPGLSPRLAQRVDHRHRVADEARIRLAPIHRGIKGRLHPADANIVERDDDRAVAEHDQGYVPAHEIAKKKDAEGDLHEAGQETTETKLYDEVERLSSLLARRPDLNGVVLQEEGRCLAQEAREERLVGDERQILAAQKDQEARPLAERLRASEQNRIEAQDPQHIGTVGPHREPVDRSREQVRRCDGGQRSDECGNTDNDDRRTSLAPIIPEQMF